MNVISVRGCNDDCCPSCKLCEDDWAGIENGSDISTDTECGYTETDGEWGVAGERVWTSDANALVTVDMPHPDGIASAIVEMRLLGQADGDELYLCANLGDAQYSAVITFGDAGCLTLYDDAWEELAKATIFAPADEAVVMRLYFDGAETGVFAAAVGDLRVRTDIDVSEGFSGTQVGFGTRANPGGNARFDQFQFEKYFHDETGTKCRRFLSCDLGNDRFKREQLGCGWEGPGTIVDDKLVLEPNTEVLFQVPNASSGANRVITTFSGTDNSDEIIIIISDDGAGDRYFCKVTLNPVYELGSEWGKIELYHNGDLLNVCPPEQCGLPPTHFSGGDIIPSEYQITVSLESGRFKAQIGENSEEAFGCCASATGITMPEVPTKVGLGAGAAADVIRFSYFDFSRMYDDDHTECPETVNCRTQKCVSCFQYGNFPRVAVVDFGGARLLEDSILQPICDRIAQPLTTYTLHDQFPFMNFAYSECATNSFDLIDADPETPGNQLGSWCGLQYWETMDPNELYNGNTNPLRDLCDELELHGIPDVTGDHHIWVHFGISYVVCKDENDVYYHWLTVWFFSNWCSDACGCCPCDDCAASSGAAWVFRAECPDVPEAGVPITLYAYTYPQNFNNQCAQDDNCASGVLSCLRHGGALGECPGSITVTPYYESYPSCHESCDEPCVMTCVSDVWVETTECQELPYCNCYYETDSSITYPGDSCGGPGDPASPLSASCGVPHCGGECTMLCVDQGAYNSWIETEGCPNVLQCECVADGGEDGPILPFSECDTPDDTIEGTCTKNICLHNECDLTCEYEGGAEVCVDEVEAEWTCFMSCPDIGDPQHWSSDNACPWGTANPQERGGFVVPEGAPDYFNEGCQCMGEFEDEWVYHGLECDADHVLAVLGSSVLPGTKCYHVTDEMALWNSDDCQEIEDCYCQSDTDPLVTEIHVCTDVPLGTEETDAHCGGEE